jgi:hypothetical protein
MANYFEITPPEGLSVVKLDNSGRARVQYTVKNVSAIRRDGRAQLVSVPAAPGAVEKNWVKVEPPTDRSFDPGQSQNYAVTIAVPPKSPPGSYSFRLDTVLVARPDEGDSSSPLTFNVVSTVAPAKPFRWWIPVVALVALVILGVVLWLVLRPKPSDHSNSGDNGSHSDKIEVPDLKGDTPEQAQKKLQDAGLKLDPSYGSVTTSDQSEVGKVGKQSPPPGHKVDKDSAVQISVAALSAPPPPPPPSRDCTYGPDTCKQGFVWREASSSDHVCVTPDVRAQVNADNGLAPLRRNPLGGPYGPDTCLQGFVWRDAFQGDHICVLGATRSQAAADNAAAQSRKSCP